MQLVSCGLRIGLDNGSGDVPFISHAHSDHLNGIGRKKEIIASAETIELAGLSAKITVPANAKLLDAGHILGSRQLFVEEDGDSVVYAGDIRVKDSLLFKGAEIRQCERLIMDGTYADPQYKFSPAVQVYDEIAKWVRENAENNLIIGCYDLGKTQEVVKILNEYAGIAPIVNENAEYFCKVYEKFGIKLNRVEVGSDEAEEVMKKPFVAIVPMRQAKRYFARRLAEAFNRKTLAAAATGWALHRRYDVDTAFALSDHADFDDIKYYIEQSGAKEVEFHCGDGSAVLKACGVKNTGL